MLGSLSSPGAARSSFVTESCYYLIHSLSLLNLLNRLCYGFAGTHTCISVFVRKRDECHCVASSCTETVS